MTVYRDIDIQLGTLDRVDMQSGFTQIAIKATPNLTDTEIMSCKTMMSSCGSLKVKKCQQK